MKNQRKFPTSSLVAAVLVTAVMFSGAVLAAAQTDSTTSGAHTRDHQGPIPSAPPAVIFKTLVNFNGTNGANGASLIQGRDGNLYGTSGSPGLLFRMTRAGKLTPVYNFCSEAGCADGNGPGDLVLGADGGLHGGTSYGGAFGYGTLFKATERGTLTTLYNFDGADGRLFKYLVQASGGNFYGTTTNGGDVTQCDNDGCGTVFKITPNGTLTTLYDFCGQAGCPNGAILFDSLVQGPNGEYYGATWGGGPANGGTIFSITPEGTLATLYSFCVVDYPYCGDGSNPITLVLGGDGNLYGATSTGGLSAGTVFKITPGGTLTTIYSFCTLVGCTDGSTPRDGMILGSDGNFYGTTYYGGANDEGTVYQITPAGVLTTLHSFHGADGNYPIGLLFQATNGTFYGTTNVGGSSGDGTIFSLAVGLNPFAETAPIAGRVGTKVIILGNKLKGASSVTFNGAASAYKVVSGTEITTTVPTGATTGPVEVTTPSGTLTSNVNFLVTP
ncbi:MAG TPA: choice-of-anchor tandem repeat GloVer-containing protein [Terriglobales bacterium]|nr:choice-of-anchor tandem repeat GloVer-containing protein [Terriglobales bacterium]